MQYTHYTGILIYFFSAIILCFFMLLFGYFLGGRSNSRFKNVPFESGVISTGNCNIKFSIKFYLVAMVFVIFDVEGIYIYIWSISIRETGWMGFSEMCLFIFILLISLIYLIRIGTFNWIQNPSKYYHTHINDLNYNTLKKFKK